MAAVLFLLSVFYAVRGQNDLPYSVICENESPIDGETAEFNVPFLIYEFPVLQDRNDPTTAPTTFSPTTNPTSNPTAYPTADPSATPSAAPTTIPTVNPTTYPTTDPTSDPIVEGRRRLQADSPTAASEPDGLCYLRLDIPPYEDSDADSTEAPDAEDAEDSDAEDAEGSDADSTESSDIDSTVGMFVPNAECTFKVTIGSPENTLEPTLQPTAPTPQPTPKTNEEATEEPSSDPTGSPSEDPTVNPTGQPTTDPTVEPTANPTSTVAPTQSPTGENPWNPQLDELDVYSIISTDSQMIAWRHGYNVDGEANYTFAVVCNDVTDDVNSTSIDPDAVQLEELEALFDVEDLNVTLLDLGDNLKNNTELFPMSYTVKRENAAFFLVTTLTAELAGTLNVPLSVDNLEVCSLRAEANETVRYYLYFVVGEAVQKIDNVVMEVTVELECVEEEKDEGDEEEWYEDIEVIIGMSSVAAVICIVSVIVACYLWRKDKDDEECVKTPMAPPTETELAAGPKTEEEMEDKVSEFVVSEEAHKQMVDLAKQNSLSAGLEYWVDEGMDKREPKKEESGGFFG